MTDTPAQGSQATLAIDAALPFDVSSEPFEFVSEDLRMIQTHVQSEGIRGTRSRYEDRVRIGSERVSGSIVMNPSAAEIDLLLPRILGGTTAGGVTAVAETLPEFQVMIDRITKVFTYSACRVSRWVLSGTAGQPLTFSIEIEGETESVGAAGSYPALTIDTGNMFIFSDAAITLEASARKIGSFTLTLDNVLDAERFHNSLTRAEIAAQDRTVTLDVDVPYTSDNEDLYDLAIAGSAGSLVVTDGTDTYTIGFGNVKIPATSPVVQGRSEIRFPFQANCYQDGATKEILVTKT